MNRGGRKFYTFTKGQVKGTEFTEISRLVRRMSDVTRPSNGNKLWHYDKNKYPKRRASLPNLAKEQPRFKVYSISKPNPFTQRRNSLPKSEPNTKKLLKVYSISRPIGNRLNEKPPVKQEEPRTKTLKLYSIKKVDSPTPTPRKNDTETKEKPKKQEPDKKKTPREEPKLVEEKPAAKKTEQTPTQTQNQPKQETPRKKDIVVILPPILMSNRSINEPRFESMERSMKYFRY